MKVEYKIAYGNKKIVFIKSGAGGNASGYKNKYIRMAQRIHDCLGATVICSSNPDMPHEKSDEAAIRRIVSEKSFSDFEVYFIGTSDGAYQNLLLAKRFPETVKLVGINTSFIDISDFEERLRALPDVHKVLIYGTEDDDFDEIAPMLSEMTCDKLELKFVDGADHSFTGMPEELIALADYL